MKPFYTVDWVNDWSRLRKQPVVLRGTSSNWQPVTQGSVLGPLLLIIYINDVIEGLECQMIKFADETKLYRAIRSEQDAETLQKDIAKIEQ